MIHLAPLVLATAFVGAQPPSEDDDTTTSACIAAYSEKPDALEIDEGRWARLCRKGLSQDDIAVRAELAAPCLPAAAEAPKGPGREKAKDRCWGLVEAEAHPETPPVPKGEEEKEEDSPAAGPALSAKNQAVAQAVADGDVAKIYGESTPAVDALIAQALAPAGGPSPAAGSGGGSGGGSLAAFSPDSIEVPDPGQGTPPAEIPACGQVRTDPKGGSNAKLYARLEAGIACIPVSAAREPLLHYLKVLGLRGYEQADSLGAKNAGLNRFYESLTLEDPVFKEKVRRFYELIRAQDAALERPDKITLEAKTGAGRFASLSPGWAWRAALKEADGDPNMAMRLIGFLGHDNVMQARILTKRSPEEAATAMAESRTALLKRIARIEDELTAKGEAFDYEPSQDALLLGPIALQGDTSPALLKFQRRTDLATLKRLRLEDFSVKADDLHLPSNSALFAPGSLDAEADVSQTVRERVAEAQAPKTGAMALGAKYYHVLAAAATTCELARKGAPGWFAGMVQTNAAWAYRTLRLDEKAQAALFQREAFKAEFQMLQASTSGGEAMGFENFMSDKFLKAASADALPGSETPEKLKKARVELSYVDAFTLMETRGYGGQRVLGQRLPVMTTRVDWPWNWFSRGVPKGWSRERTKAAESRLESFLADSEWTVAQHAAGARFAAKRCRKEAPAGVPLANGGGNHPPG